MGDFGIFDLLYIVGLTLITALTFALLVVRFLPLILGAVLVKSIKSIKKHSKI